MQLQAVRIKSEGELAAVHGCWMGCQIPNVLLLCRRRASRYQALPRDLESRTAFAPSTFRGYNTLHGSVQCGCKCMTAVSHGSEWPRRTPVLFQPYNYPWEIPCFCSNFARMHVSGSRLNGWWLGCFAGIARIQPGCFVRLLQLHTCPLGCSTSID
jgi:hypothetical protein